MEEKKDDRGTWVVEERCIPLVYRCSVCCSSSPETYPYCPYCGKPMNPEWEYVRGFWD